MILNSVDEVFSKIKVEDFRDIVSSVVPDNAETLVQEWQNNNPGLKTLQERWEKSLDSLPDFSVYDEPIYLNETFLCWKAYSRRYLMLLRKWLKREDCPIKVDGIKNVLDLGCGLALTTIGLKSLFPNAEVYGTNEPNSVQIEFDRIVTRPFDDIHIVSDNFGPIKHMDIVFASEFFEHIQVPIEFLKKVLVYYKPKYIIYANTFTNMAIGHFNEYYVGIEKLSGKEVSRAFTRILQYYGNKKVQTNFFNNRPNVYKLERSRLI